MGEREARVNQIAMAVTQTTSNNKANPKRLTNSLATVTWDRFSLENGLAAQMPVMQPQIWKTYG